MGLDVVAGVIEDAPQCVADDRVPGAAHVDRPGRVRARVLEHDARLAVRQGAVVVALDGGGDGLGDVGVARQEVAVRAAGLDGAHVPQVVDRHRCREVGGDSGRRGLRGAREAVGDARGEDGLDVLGRSLDAEVAGRVPEVGERRLQGLGHLGAQGAEHGDPFPSPGQRGNGFASLPRSSAEVLRVARGEGVEAVLDAVVDAVQPARVQASHRLSALEHETADRKGDHLLVLPADEEPARPRAPLEERL